MIGVYIMGIFIMILIIVMEIKSYFKYPVETFEKSENDKSDKEEIK